jgi:hypothetical protein
MPSVLVDHLLDASAAADPRGLLAEHVRFRSPYADYDGREAIVPLLAVMPEVFDELAVVRELLGDDGEVAVLLHGRIGDEEVDVVVDERRAADGRVIDLMLLTRPYAGTKAAIRRMGTLLAAR